MLRNKKVFANRRQQYTAVCGSGFSGSLTATIEAGTVFSAMNVEDADQKALDKAVENANAGLICTPSFGYAAYFLSNNVCVTVLQ